MPAELIDAYLDAFAARCELLRRPSQPLVDGAGAYGLMSSAIPRGSGVASGER